MAKEVITRDRFKITAEINAESLGPLLAQLARMGLQNIEYELITDVRTFHGNSERKVHDVAGPQFAFDTFLPTHDRFRAKHFIKHFEENGRTAGAAYSVLRTFADAGTVTKTDDGWYERAGQQQEQLALPKPGETATEPAAEEEPRKRFETSGREEVERFLKNRKHFTAKQVGDLFEEQGRKYGSASPIIHELLVERRIKRTGAKFSGEYLVVKPAAETST